MQQMTVIGGGLVGLVTAIQLALAAPSQRVLLIEPKAFNTDDEAHLDVRSTALSLGSIRLLQKLGIDTSVFGEDISTIHVSASGHFASAEFNGEECGYPQFGRVVENTLLLRAMLARTKAISNLHIQHEVFVDRIEPDKHAHKILLGHGEVLHSELVIIADGSNSSLARRLGVPIKQMDFRQTALVFNLGLSESHKGVARERFSDGMPLALLPLTRQRYAAVWCLDPAEADWALSLGRDEFSQHFLSKASDRISGVTEVGKRIVFPLVQYQAMEIYRRGLAIVGNASHTLHPVAGQGFNLCLREGDSLARFVSKTSNLYELDYLRAWAAHIEVDQFITVNGSSGLVKLFESASGSVLRSLGIQLLCSQSGLRDGFLERAAGVAFGQGQ